LRGWWKSLAFRGKKFWILVKRLVIPSRIGVWDAIGTLMGSKDIELVTAYASERWQVETDHGQMEQMIMKLAVNARGTMLKGGRLIFEMATVEPEEGCFREHGMPGESGLELVRFVKAEYPHVRIVMVTAVDDQETARAVLNVGVYGYIVKPFDRSQIIIKVGNALRLQELERHERFRREELKRTVGKRTAQLQVIVDGTDSNTAGIVLDYSARIVGQFSNKILIMRFTRLKGSASKPRWVEVRIRSWFNENLESRSFYVQGVMAIIVMLITLMLTSMAVVQEKEIGTMEKIMVTP
jgi:DNA-binding NarL/FixJ family response regulator